ncbi:hypothetical protein PM082_006541 [Marasmius tenuissimus]|nr:hypothetical protein PM082_006541 [Marasmius tenuissimus]
MKFVERAANGTTSSTYSDESHPRRKKKELRVEVENIRANGDVQGYMELALEFLSKVFLPEGYPATVSPGRLLTSTKP